MRDRAEGLGDEREGRRNRVLHIHLRHAQVNGGSQKGKAATAATLLGSSPLSESGTIA